MLAGELYIAEDPELARDSERAMSLTHQFNSMNPTDGAARRKLLTELLGAFGEGSEIRPPFRCDYGYQTFIGARTFANFGLISLDVASVTIGDDVQIGPNVQLLTPTHPVAAGLRRDKWEAAKPITIGNNVWLGGGVIVCPAERGRCRQSGPHCQGSRAVTAPAGAAARGAGAGQGSGGVKAVRRYDPDRKARIVDAAVEVIAEYGVAGTTHRRIAAAADVPLGSLTYHFAGLDDLLAQAFRRHAERMSRAYEMHFEGVRTREQFVAAVTDLIHGLADDDPRDWAVAYELYLAALRDPALRSVTEAWMRSSRAVLERFVDSATARGVDALIEGIVMHKTLSTTGGATRAETHTIITRVLGESS
jgi:DNA-binding transcriptional regulator YbjK/acetyltransferase-like isoleucine patch superfamily enzyme